MPTERHRDEPLREANHRPGQERRARQEQEEGQGLMESAVGLLFLLLILLVMFEMLFVFTSYIALLNASAQGAIRAAGHPQMEVGDYHYQEYVSDIQGEVVANGLSWTDVHVNPPELPAVVEAGNPITVTLAYTLTTPFGEIFFPIVGKFGLPTQYHISARTAVPIR